MIDIHSHILPGVDDGSQDTETSLKMLKMASTGRTDTIVATPHYNMHFTSADYETAVRESKRLNEIAEENDIDISVIPGQEINIETDVVRLYNEGVIGCIGDTRYMLLELRYKGIDNTDLEKIYEMRLKGIIPIIPHPERYDYIIKKPSIVNQLLDEGCLMQINTGSILGLFGKECMKTAELLIKHNAVHLIASDCHGIGRRCPNLHEGIRNIKDKKYAQVLLANSKSLLKDEQILNSSEKISERKRLFGFL